MKKRKLLLLFSLLSSYISPATAKLSEDEAFSKIVNDMPYCYVILELSELEVKSESQPYAKFFYLYNQAAQELLSQDEWYKIPVSFNQQTLDKRKKLLRIIKDEDDQSRTLKRVYQDYGCGIYAEI